MKLTIIATIGKNNELGKCNDFIWNAYGDLSFFEEKTKNKIIVMGRKTYETLPHYFENIKYVILTRTGDNYPENSIVFISFNKLLEYLNTLEEEVFVIGGESIYRQLMPYVNTMYLTEIEMEEKEADAFFPFFNKLDWKVETFNEGVVKIKDNYVKYRQLKYERE